MDTSRKEKSKIFVEMWFDYMCPLCCIGKINIENAAADFGHKEDVEIRFRPFQLFPDAPLNTKRNYYEYTSLTHNGISVGYIKEKNQIIVELAKTFGLNYDLDNLIPTNTADALRITFYAQEKGKAKELSALLYKAYLEEGRDIAEAATLTAIAVEAGLPADEIANVLKTDAYVKELKDNRVLGEKIGVRGTPFFNLNNSYAISGLKEKEDLMLALNEVWEQANSWPLLKIIEGQSCGADGECT